MREHPRYFIEVAQRGVPEWSSSEDGGNRANLDGLASQLGAPPAGRLAR